MPILDTLTFEKNSKIK